MVLDSVTVPEEIENLLTRETVRVPYRDTTAGLKDLQCTIDCPCQDYPVRVLFVHNLNLSKPTGLVMHQQFNIQQLYALPTLCLCVLYLSENKQRLVPLTA